MADKIRTMEFIEAPTFAHMVAMPLSEDEYGELQSEFVRVMRVSNKNLQNRE